MADRNPLSYLYENDLKKLAASRDEVFDTLDRLQPYGVTLREIVEGAKQRVSELGEYLDREIGRIDQIGERDG